MGTDEELRQQNRELALVAEIGRVLAASANLDQGLEVCLTKVRDILGAKSATVLLWDDEADGLQIVGHDGLQPEIIVAVNQRLRGQRTGSVTVESYFRGVPIIIRDLEAPAAAKYDLTRSLGRPKGVRSLYVTPLIHQEKTLGVLTIQFAEPQEFLQARVDYLRDLAVQISAAVRIWSHTQEAGEQRDLLASLIAHSPAAMVRVDRNFRYKWMNQAFLQMVGMPREALEGKTVFEVFPHFGGSHSELEEVMLGGRAKSFQTIEDASPGSTNPRYFQATYAPILGNGAVVDGALMLFLEVTERIESEALHAREMASMQRADALKDEFLSILSHELRTPIHAVMGYTSMLEEGVTGDLNPAQADYLQKVLDGAGRLASLVDDLLDVTRIQAGKFLVHLEPTDLSEPIREALEVVEPMARDRGIRVILEIAGDMPLVSADGPRLAQVFQNLLTNAIKFSPVSGMVKLVIRTEGALVRCEVEDGGPGIPTDYFDCLFERFSQIDMSSTRSHGGLGLGLSICRAIVAEHGGQIGVESVIGQGSLFWFTLKPSP